MHTPTPCCHGQVTWNADGQRTAAAIYDLSSRDVTLSNALTHKFVTVTNFHIAEPEGSYIFICFCPVLLK
jgi:poly(3-hydroxyalkanoate) synthetase